MFQTTNQLYMIYEYMIYVYSVRIYANRQTNKQKKQTDKQTDREADTQQTNKEEHIKINYCIYINVCVRVIIYTYT